MKSQIKTFALFGAFAAGFCLPRASCLSFLIRYMIALMMFFSLLKLRPSRKPLLKEHWLIFGANLLLGVGSWGVLLLTGSSVLAQAAFFTGITPTATAASAVTSLLGGRAEFVISGFLVTNIGMALLLPMLIPLVTGSETSGLFLHVAGSLLFVMGLPFAAVLLFHKFVKKKDFFLKISASCSFYVWVAAIFLIIANAADFLYSRSGGAGDALLIALLSAVICFLNFYLGNRIGRKKRFLECGQTLGQKNTTLTIYLALTYASPAVALGPAFYVIWHNTWNAVQLWKRTAHLNRIAAKRGKHV
ncbi:MAG: hypothetical protein IKC65_04590 [Lentisphaeria bacterium]|nr:hypothetical protein [Lentisphaeria bacterium]